jgi:hypothetical protein
MALMNIQVIPPFDGNNFTGPTRAMAGVARMLTVVPDTAYGEKMRWLYVGVTGDVSVVLYDGTTQLIVGLAAGVFHPIYTLMVNSVGTTATNIIVGS